MSDKTDLFNNIEKEDNNLRKYLIIGGGVFVLFVVGIVAAKFMFSKPKQNNTEVILPPEIKQEKTQKQDTALFNDIPVENQANNQDNTFKKPTTETKVEQPEIKKEPVQKPEPIVEKVEPTPQPKPEPKKVVNKPKVEKKIVQKTKSIKGNYYIQVAAVTRANPSKRFLKLIKKNGFNYKIEEVNVKGMKVKRILIGGYTKSEAKKQLPIIKKKISSSAFIKRLK